MNIDYRLDLALRHLDLALNGTTELLTAVDNVQKAADLLRGIKADLHRTPDPRQTAFPLR